VAKTIPNNPYEAMLLNTGPVPGESLTVAPKTLPCEKPPQYPRLEDALQYSWEALVDRTDKIVALAKLGMSLRDQCQRFLMEGFTRGLWSVDMLILMGHPVLAMHVAICELSDTKYELVDEGYDEDPELTNIARALAAKENAASAAGAPAAVAPQAPQMPAPANDQGVQSVQTQPSPPRAGGLMGDDEE
jgi:hypothetical protein